MGKQCDGENLPLTIFMGQQVSSHQEQSLFNILNNHLYILKKKGINLYKSTGRICEIQKQAGMGVERQLRLSGESKKNKPNNKTSITLLALQFQNKTKGSESPWLGARLIQVLRGLKQQLIMT